MTRANVNVSLLNLTSNRPSMDSRLLVPSVWSNGKRNVSIPTMCRLSPVEATSLTQDLLPSPSSWLSEKAFNGLSPRFYSFTRSKMSWPLLALDPSSSSSSYPSSSIHPLNLSGFSDLSSDMQMYLVSVYVEKEVLKEREKFLKEKVEMEKEILKDKVELEKEILKEKTQKEKVLKLKSEMEKELLKVLWENDIKLEKIAKERAEAVISDLKNLQFFHMSPLGKLVIRSIIESLESSKLSHSYKRGIKGLREDMGTTILNQDLDVALPLQSCDPKLSYPQIAREISELYRLWFDDVHKYIQNGPERVLLPENITTPLRTCLAIKLGEIYGLKVTFLNDPKNEGVGKNEREGDGDKVEEK